MIVVRYFPALPHFYLCCLFHIDLLWTSYPGYIFLFSGSHSEQDDSVEDSDSLGPSFTTQTSELENYTNFNDSQDLYQILGVQRNASSKEIRQAYLELPKKNYPKI